MSYKFTLIPSPPDPRDWKVKNVLKSKVLGIFPRLLPSAIDYRDYLKTVRDQGNQGSCAAMAASAMKEFQEVKDVDFKDYMSPQFIYNNREGYPNTEGMYTRDVLKILTNLGDCGESIFPYGSLGKPPQDAYDQARHYPIGGYAWCDTIDDLKLALYTNGPCLIAFPVYNFTGRFWKKNPGDYLLGYHMVLVCGYDNERFIIRNSWGEDWGDNGYTYFPYEDWGWQEEVATTIDTDSDDYIPPVPDKSWFSKYWWILLIIAGIAIYFIVR